MTVKAYLFQLCHRLGSPAILFWSLPYMMILIALGTIAQKDIGLYQAIQIYFSGWILWWGPLPLPGFFAVMSLFSINLFFRFLFKSPWRWDKAGLHLAHFGGLVLVLGGLITVLTAREGFLAVPEGQNGHYISSYHDRVLVIFEGNQAIKAIPFQALKREETFSIADDISLTVKQTCRHCRIETREVEADMQDMARFMRLQPDIPKKQDEQNRASEGFG